MVLKVEEIVSGFSGWFMRVWREVDEIVWGGFGCEGMWKVVIENLDGFSLYYAWTPLIRSGYDWMM